MKSRILLECTLWSISRHSFVSPSKYHVTERYVFDVNKDTIACYPIT